MLQGDKVQVIGDSVWRGFYGEVVECDDDGFAIVAIPSWSGLRREKIWINYLSLI